MNQRQSWKWDAEAAFKRIEGQELERREDGNTVPDAVWFDKQAMKAPYAPPPNVAAWLKAQADKPKPHGRDIESLMRYHEAHKKPVGYWEDAPRGMKFGESANGRPADFESASEGSSPSSPATPPPADDEFEPVGTMPVVGDRIVCHEFQRYGIDVVTLTGIGTINNFESDAKWPSGASVVPYKPKIMDGTARILKRPTKPRDDVATGARVWADEGFVWVQLAGVMYECAPGKCAWGRTSDLKPEWELHGAVRDAIIAECCAAMKLDLKTGEPINK